MEGISKVGERKEKSTWCMLEPTFHEALMNYIKDHDMSVSEFVRGCIVDRLLDEDYISKEQLELVIV